MIDPRDARIGELEALVVEMRAELATLRAEVAELKAKLGQSSRNSNKPPSSDPPAQRAERPVKKGSGRKPGGQPGHQGHRRQLLPPDRVHRFIRHDPESCRRCGDDLDGAEILDPVIRQFIDAVRIIAEVVQLELGVRRCHCGTVTCAPTPPGVPRGMCGPQLMGLIALLTGVYHLSRRSARQLLGDVLGIHLSLGALSGVEAKVSAALAAPYAQARRAVRGAPTKNVDATSWYRGAEQRSLWVMASRVATVFAVGVAATTDVVKKLCGTLGVLMSDRGSQFGFWAMAMRQICWAHLIRKWVSFTDSGNPEVQALGEQLLLLSQAHLHAWHRVRDGTLSRRTLQKIVRGMTPHFIAHLDRGAALRLRGVSGVCENLLEHQKALFTYAFVEGVEPTNNHAERELRAFVLWRKRSHGSKSDRGDRFAERVMTAVHTLRKQRRHVLSYLVDACTAALLGEPAPSLFLTRGSA